MASPEERDIQRITQAIRELNKEIRAGKIDLSEYQRIFRELQILGRLGGAQMPYGTGAIGGRGGAPMVRDPRTGQYTGGFEQWTTGAYQQMQLPFRTMMPSVIGGMGGEQAADLAPLIQMAGGWERVQKVLTTASAALGGVELGLKNINKIIPDTTKGITSFAVKTDDGIGRAVVQMDRLGNATVRTGRVSRDFFDMVTRNIGKVVQWAIAVGLVYGALRKVSLVMTDMREFQTIFAEVAIVMGTTSDAATQYFDSMYKIAKLTGITVKDVAKSYDDALRATADLTDETQRAAVTEQLLTDSLILAQIAGIDSAEAFDILVGALRQVGYGLDEGIKLLDKWVAVSRVSVTSVYGLAQAFAITGTAAQTAGVDVNQLTGMIAGMMEVSVLTETRAANAIRAFMSSFTTQRSVSALQQHGFAVKTLDGNYRSLWDILSEIAAAYQTGALSPTGLKQITDAIGGGYRRAAQVEALIKGWPRVQFAAAASMNAHGEAADALDIKMETLQVSINQLTSAWQRLAEVLMEAGLVEDLTRIVSVMTGLLDVISTLTEKLGPFLIRMAEMMALIGLARYVGPRVGAMMGVGGGLGMQMALPGMGAGMMAGAAGAAAKYAGPLALAATAVIPIITEGFTQEAMWQSAGGLFAGAVGLALGGPIGALIGATIGQGIVEAIQRRQEKAAVPLSELPMEELVSERLELTNILRRTIPMPGAPERGLLVEARQQYEERIRVIDEEMAARKAMTEEGLEEESDAYTQYYLYIVQLEQQLGRELPSLRKRTMELLQKYSEGEITRAEYRASVAQLEQTYNIIFKAFDKLHEELGVTLPEMFEALAGASAEAYSEMASRISALVALDIEIIELQEQIKGGMLDEVRAVTRLHQLQQQYNETLEESVLVWEAVKRATVVELEIPPIFDFSRIVEEDLPEFFDAVVAKMQEVADVAGIPFEVMFEDAAYIGFTEGLRMFLVDPSINRQIASLVARAWEDAAEEIDLRRIKDIGEMPAVAWAAKLKEFISYYQRLFAQIGFFPEQAEIVLMLGPQNEIFRLITSQEALRYAIEDLRDVEERQLAGQWNLPAGAVAWVPISSLYYQRQETTGLPPMPEIPGEPTTPTISAPFDVPSRFGAAQWEDLIYQYAVAAGIDPKIIAAILQLESGGVSTALGAQTPWGRATGLMQVMPFHEWRLQPGESLYDPEANVRIGVEIFRELLEKYEGDIMKAVAGYYGGVIGGQISPAGEDYLKVFREAFTNLFETGVLTAEGIPTGAVTQNIVEIPSIEIPPIYGEFTIHNYIILEGAVIERYVNRILAEALTRYRRSGGTSGAGGPSRL